MPDFLQKEEKENPSTPKGALPTRFTGIRAFRSKRPGSGSNGRSAKENKGNKAIKVKKKESALFTDYYGIAFLGLVAAFIGSGYFVVSPLYADFKELNGEVEYQLQNLEEERNYSDSLDRSISAAEAIPENTLVRVDEALPRDVEIPKLLVTIAKISELNDIALSNVQFSPIEGSEEDERQSRGSSVEVIPFGISLTLQSGGYQATRSFLEDLEDNIRILDVTNVTVTGNDQDGSLSYTLDLTTYAIKKRESLRSVDGAIAEEGIMMDDGIMKGEIP